MEATMYTLILLLVVFSGSQSTLLANIRCNPKQIIKTVNIPTCQSRSGIPVKRCKGTCLSYSSPGTRKSGGVIKSCRCCRALQTHILRIQLWCLDSNRKIVKKYHDILSATSFALLIIFLLTL